MDPWSSYMRGSSLTLCTHPVMTILSPSFPLSVSNTHVHTHVHIDPPTTACSSCSFTYESVFELHGLPGAPVCAYYERVKILSGCIFPFQKPFKTQRSSEKRNVNRNCKPRKASSPLVLNACYCCNH